MTEDEAKTKWCPFANVNVPYGNTGASGNRALGKTRNLQGWEGHALCIASACMAWEWTESETVWVTDIPAYESPYGEPVMHEESRPNRQGDCGLKRRT